MNLRNAGARCTFALLLMLVGGCGKAATAKMDLSTPDFAADLRVVATMDLTTTCSGFRCCPNDLPQTGSCTPGDQCAGFELYCTCKSSQWSCQIGNGQLDAGGTD